MVKVKIYGYGVVGKVIQKLFPEAVIHDPIQGLETKARAEIAFVCVPTPNLKNGALDMSIVEDVITNGKEDLFIVRSALQPGTADRLEKLGKNIVVQPEYIGEGVNPPLLDESKTPFMVLGGSPQNTQKVIELYQGVYNANIKIRQVSNLEAEIIKLSENRAIMFKVAQCQELYDVCTKAGANYYTVREAVYGDDPRFNLWWTFVYPKKRGASSKCIPKDVYAWAAWAEYLGYEPEITRAILERNKKWLASNSQ